MRFGLCVVVGCENRLRTIPLVVLGRESVRELDVCQSSETGLKNPWSKIVDRNRWMMRSEWRIRNTRVVYLWELILLVRLNDLEELVNWSGIGNS